jgi:hypothetical protein
MRQGSPHPLSSFGVPLLFALSLAAIFVLAITQVTSYDTWVHLALGRWMSEHGALPRTNLLSHTMPDRPTLTHQWLFQYLLYQGWELMGPRGVILTKAVVVAGAFALALATARRKGAGPVVTCLCVVVAASAARFRFTLRPQVVAFLLLATYLYLLERGRAGKGRALLVLLPLQVLWGNLHGSAVLGIGIAVGFAAAESVRRLLVADAPDRRALATLWVVALLLVPASLLNPHGAGLLSMPFAHAGAQSASGLKEFLRDRASVKLAELSGEHVFFAALAAAGVATLWASVRRRDVAETGLVLGLMVLAARSERFIGIFAVAAAPIIARNVTESLGWLRAQERGRCVAGASLVLLLAWLGARHSSAAMPFGLTVRTTSLPETELAFVDAEFPKARIYNEFEHGGYIAWASGRPVFLDSRGVLAYDAAFLRRYVSLWTTPDPSLDWLAEYGVTVALVWRPPVRGLFEADRHWRLATRGPVCAVYVRVPEEARRAALSAGGMQADAAGKHPHR